MNCSVKRNEKSMVIPQLFCLNLKGCTSIVFTALSLLAGDAEIISMDAYTRTEHHTSPKKVDTIVIAIALALVKVMFLF